MEFLFYFLGGVLIGFIVAAIIYRARLSGTLRIAGDEDGEYVFAVLKNGIYDIRDKKVVKFLVEDLTQK